MKYLCGKLEGIKIMFLGNGVSEGNVLPATVSKNVEYKVFIIEFNRVPLEKFAPV